MMGELVWVTFTKVLRETDRAYLFLTRDGEIWLPKSQIEDLGAHGEVQIPKWLAEEKELEYDES
jgi:hypothetical protein